MTKRSINGKKLITKIKTARERSEDKRRAEREKERERLEKELQKQRAELERRNKIAEEKAEISRMRKEQKEIEEALHPYKTGLKKGARKAIKGIGQAGMAFLTKEEPPKRKPIHKRSKKRPIKKRTTKKTQMPQRINGKRVYKSKKTGRHYIKVKMKNGSYRRMYLD